MVDASRSRDHRRSGRRPRVAVVGHVEWLEFARVQRVPRQGEIVHAEEVWEEVGGGGAVAAVQLAKLAGECLFFTAFGDDELGRTAHSELEALGVTVLAARRAEPQRRAFVSVDSEAERTITVIGDRLAPRRADPLPWGDLNDVDAVYLTAGDADAVRAARHAERLVATPRALGALAESGVPVDVLVSSGSDEGERYRPGDLDPAPTVIARTLGAEGGTLLTAEAGESRWEASPLPGPAIDSYGSGDSFAAGLTYGLGLGRSVEQAAALGARCGAASMTGRGPYRGQIQEPLE